MLIPAFERNEPYKPFLDFLELGFDVFKAFLFGD